MATHGNLEKTAEIKKQCVLMVMRQTTYSFEEAQEKLAAVNYDYHTVLKDYMGVEKKDEEKKTTNQQIYHQIRGFMDNAAADFRRKKELSEQINEQQMNMQRQQQMNMQRQQQMNMQRQQNQKINPKN